MSTYDPHATPRSMVAYNFYLSIYHRDECNISNINDNKTFAVAQDKDRGTVSRLSLQQPVHLGMASDVQYCNCINLMEVRGHRIGVHLGFVYEIALPRYAVR